MTRTERVRLPITVEIMHQIYSVLSMSPTKYQGMMLWAAYCIAFFGFLRVGKMTTPSRDAYDSSVHLSLGDVALDSRLNIKQSKTDLFRKGAKLCLGRTESVVCPVKTLLPYLAVRGSAPGPLFLSEDGVPLTRAHFKTLLSTTLKRAGLDDSKYNTHSFRIGATTSAKAVGMADVHIQMLGRWRSSAYQAYIRTPAQVLTKLSKQLVSQGTLPHPQGQVPGTYP